MPKRTDIQSILIIGAGPIVIGQACEFDYSGAQACKALREEGYRVILVNSNPATIMTDPEMADVTYIEPITWEVVERIIATEKPDAILPTMGGQTALNCALDLHRHGVLKKYSCELIGASPEAIDKAEDRQKFKDAMTKIGLGSAKSGIAHSMDEAISVQQRIQAETGSSGFPVVIRPSFTMGGSGGGIAYNREEFEEICKRGLDLSPTRELLIEESLLGWKEFEMEVVRDRGVTHDLIFFVSQRLRRGDGDRVTGMHAHWIKVFDGANDDAIIRAVTHDFHLELFPSEQRLFDQQLACWRGFKAATTNRFKLFGVIGNATTGTTKREAWTNHQRKTAAARDR